jgi:hypothetical protein
VTVVAVFLAWVVGEPEVTLGVLTVTGGVCTCVCRATCGWPWVWGLDLTTCLCVLACDRLLDGLVTAWLWPLAGALELVLVVPDG